MLVHAFSDKAIVHFHRDFSRASLGECPETGSRVQHVAQFACQLLVHVKPEAKHSNLFFEVIHQNLGFRNHRFHNQFFGLHPALGAENAFHLLLGHFFKLLELSFGWFLRLISERGHQVFQGRLILN